LRVPTSIGGNSGYMTTSTYDLHVFGLNLSGTHQAEREKLALTRAQIANVLEALAAGYPTVEAVVVRARNHIEAFLAAPSGTDLVRAWLSVLRRFRPDLLHAGRRPLHYHLAGVAAQEHLLRIAGGRYAHEDATSSVHAGVKDSLALAAGCGTLGETLDCLFLNGLEASLGNAPGPRSSRDLVIAL
jgi:glutamyl-tRNA reductase